MVDPDSASTPTGIGRHHSSFPDMIPPTAAPVPPPRQVGYRGDLPPLRPLRPPLRRPSSATKLTRILIALVAAFVIVVQIVGFFHRTGGHQSGTAAAQAQDTPGQTPSSPFWTILAPGSTGFYDWGADQSEAQSALQSLTAQGIHSPAVAVYDVYNDPTSHLLFYGVAFLDGTVVPDDLSSTTFDGLRQDGNTVGTPQAAANLPDGYGTAQCASVAKPAVHHLMCIWRVNTAYAVFTFTGAVPADVDAAGKTVSSIIRDLAQPY